jgi:hypothetical protein
VFGGSLCSTIIFCRGEVLQKGYLLVPLQAEVDLQVQETLNHHQKAVEKAILSQTAGTRSRRVQTAGVLVQRQLEKMS